MSRLRLAFMGTPEFAVPALAALKRAGHAIAAVYTQPARKAGRGQRSQASPVARIAAAHELPLRTPANLRLGAEAAQFEALALDAAVVAAYGLILPNTFLASPRLGCLNIHASLLPRWRGAAPIARAILAGDRESGVTIMKMDDTLDTGAILLKESVAIEPTMTAGELHDALAALGARLIVPALDGIAAGRLEPKPQPGQGISYAPKIDKAETRLDWRRPALMLERQVRAFAPVPGAPTTTPMAAPPAPYSTSGSRSRPRLGPCASSVCSAQAVPRWPPPTTCAGQCSPPARCCHDALQAHARV